MALKRSNVRPRTDWTIVRNVVLIAIAIYAGAYAMVWLWVAL